MHVWLLIGLKEVLWVRRSAEFPHYGLTGSMGSPISLPRRSGR